MNPELEEKIRLFALNYRPIKVEVALAVVQYHCNGELFLPRRSLHVDAELTKAASHLGIEKEAAGNVLTKHFGSEVIPNMVFHADGARSIQSIGLKKMKKFVGRDLLSSFKWGILCIPASSILSHYELGAFPSVWEEAIAKYANSMEMQVAHLFDRLTELSQSIERKDNLLVAYAGRYILQYKHKIVSPTPEARELSRLVRLFEQVSLVRMLFPDDKETKIAEEQ